MNYNEYYARQAGGALPYFAGALYQRGHGLGNLFGGLLRSAMPLIKRGAVALGRGALKSGVGKGGVEGWRWEGGGVEDRRAHSRRRLVWAEHKRHVTDAGKNLMSGLLTPGVRPRKRIKCTPVRSHYSDETTQQTDV